MKVGSFILMATLLTTGGTDAQFFLKNEIPALWNRLSPDFRANVQSLDALQKSHDKIIGLFGNERKVFSEKEDEKTNSYQRISAFEKQTVPIYLNISYDNLNQISLFSVQGHIDREAPSDFLTYKTKTSLKLPFSGEWAVVWGGRTLKENHHAFDIVQRFAYDILIVRNNATHTSDGKQNEDYFAFGQSVLAPASGTIVTVFDGEDDNIPGQMNPDGPGGAGGNHLLIDHGNGEFSFFAHFKKGSIKVKTGDRISTGQVLGLCGNSGNSSEAHIHYHLQNGLDPIQSEGLPAQFDRFIDNSKVVTRIEPVQGEFIQNAEEVK
jgi:murein DD-endopeptidase MepM/ murein hydrolase activator NlpD